MITIRVSHILAAIVVGAAWSLFWWAVGVLAWFLFGGR